MVKDIFLGLCCLFWLPLTAGAAIRIGQFGYDNDTAPLILIPLVMLLLTGVTKLLLDRVVRKSIVIVPASVCAMLGALGWVGIWGAGV
jgi:hypothetical protein